MTAHRYSMLVQWWHRFIMPVHNTWQLVPNKSEHESDDHASGTVTSVYITNEKDMALQRQIWSTFVTLLWCSKTKITNGTGILVLVRVLWDMISKIYWQFWHSFLKNVLESIYNFNPIEITWRKMVHSFCLKPVSMATWRLHTLWRFTVPAFMTGKGWEMIHFSLWPIRKFSGSYFDQSAISQRVILTNQQVLWELFWPISKFSGS